MKLPVPVPERLALLASLIVTSIDVFLGIPTLSGFKQVERLSEDSGKRCGIPDCGSAAYLQRRAEDTAVGSMSVRRRGDILQPSCEHYSGSFYQSLSSHRWELQLPTKMHAQPFCERLLVALRHDRRFSSPSLGERVRI